MVWHSKPIFDCDVILYMELTLQQLGLMSRNLIKYNTNQINMQDRALTHPLKLIDQLTFLYCPLPQQTLKQIYLPHPSEEKTILELLQVWQVMDLPELIIPEFTSSQSIQLYKSSQILSAFIFAKVKQFVYDVKFKKLSNEFCEGAEQFGQFLREKELKISMNKDFWQKEKFNSYSSYHIASSHEKDQPDTPKYAIQVMKWIQQSQFMFLKQLHQFLVGICFICVDEDPKVNQFLVKLDRISRGEQKEMFVKNISLPILEQLLKIPNNVNPIGYEQLTTAMEKALPNYFFYRNSLKLTKKNRNISLLFEKYENYSFLEQKHDYIQWMFPNHYGSAFNSHSHPLNYLETHLFINDQQIGVNLLKSIFIFLDFIGIQLDLATLELTLISIDRLKDAVLVNTHNHLRIMRFIACLSVTGFRNIALNFISFLDQHTQKGGIIQIERQQFENRWLIYGDQQMNRAKQMCFLEEEHFPKSHSILELVQQEAKKVQLSTKKQIIMEIEDLDNFTIGKTSEAITKTKTNKKYKKKEEKNKEQDKQQAQKCKVKQAEQAKQAKQAKQRENQRNVQKQVIKEEKKDTYNQEIILPNKFAEKALVEKELAYEDKKQKEQAKQEIMKQDNLFKAKEEEDSSTIVKNEQQQQKNQKNRVQPAVQQKPIIEEKHGIEKKEHEQKQTNEEGKETRLNIIKPQLQGATQEIKQQPQQPLTT